MRRGEKPIYFYTLFTNMVFFLPVIIPYYQSIGLSFRDFLIGEAFFSAIVILSEVPSGWIADMWQRRTTLILGGLVGIIGYATLMFANGFFMACLAQGIIGVAVSLNSGTNTAILYDKLLEEGREGEYRKLDGTRHAFGLYGVAFAAVVGAFTFTIHPKLPLLLDLMALNVAIISIALTREPKRATKSTERHILHDMYVTMKYALHGHKEIAGIILLSAVLLCATKLMMWSQQPYFEQAGLPIQWFGVILAGSYVLGGIVGQSSHRFEHIGTNRAVLAAMGIMLISACIALAYGMPVFIAIPLFLTGTLGYAMIQLRINNAINQRVGSERRSTILSTASLMVHVLFIPAVWGWGLYQTMRAYTVHWLLLRLNWLPSRHWPYGCGKHHPKKIRYGFRVIITGT